MKHSLVAISLLLASALAAAAAPSVVRIVGEPGAQRLTFNGKPYFVEGGGGGGSKELLAAIGGNSFRTWGADRAKRDLDEGQRHGLTVMVGFWLGHAKHGFDYTRQDMLDKTTENTLRVVREQKDHPALLCWALGNEMELGNPHLPEMWRYINELAAKVKEIDPNHPVCTVVAEVWKEKVKQIEELCPALDFVGINSYGGSASVGKRWIENGGRKPYMITEFGPPGASEVGKTAYGCPLEWTGARKAEWYAEAYRKTILAERDRHCLGSYAFTWGTKIEGTLTWFGTLLPDGTVLAATETLQELWGHVPVRNRCPVTKDMKISKHDFKTADETAEASVEASDPDGDPLTWKWTLVEESAHYGESGLGGPVPKGFDECILEGQGTPKVRVKLPGGGKYRLYAYCFDGKGHAAVVNHPMRGTGEMPRPRLEPVALPCVVYGDGAPVRWYASGYMGNNGAVSMDEKCAENPHSGETCLKVEYRDNGNWAGVQWQHPANDWGNQPGGFNLKDATMLVFWARGKEGGEKVSFSFGGLAKSKYRDTGHGELKDVVLRKEWTRYRIALDGQDMSQIKTPFTWVLGGQGRPVTFYLDDIQYTAD